MSLGQESKFHILRKSPLDLQPQEPASEAVRRESTKTPWVPSRYNLRAKTEDGRLIVWNTYKRSLTVFSAEQCSSVELLLSKKGFEAHERGVVKYLYERGFLIKQGANEFRRIQHEFGRGHYRTDTLQLTLLASEDCNFRCQYCYEEFPRGTMQPEVRTGVKKLLEKRVESLRHFTVEWFGGEPLYGFEAIEDLAPFCVDLAATRGVGYFSGMTTNGYLLTPEIAEKLLEWRIMKYQITLDGAPEDHDRSRPTRDGQGSFWTIFNNLKALRERPEPFQVALRVNWDKTNYPNLVYFLDLVHDAFQDDSRFQVRFHPVFATRTTRKNDVQVCGLAEAAMLQADLEREVRNRGLAVDDDLRSAKPVGHGVCYAARPFHFVIGATGKVMKCTIDLDMHDRNIVGHLSEDGQMDLDMEKMALWCEPAFEQDTKCQSCVVLPICSGASCPLVRIETGESPCIALRRNFKQRLVETVEATSSEGRRTTLGSCADTPMDSNAKMAPSAAGP